MKQIPCQAKALVLNQILFVLFVLVLLSSFTRLAHALPPEGENSSLNIHSREKNNDNAQCAYCHNNDGELVRCPDSNTPMHSECLKENNDVCPGCVPYTNHVNADLTKSDTTNINDRSLSVGQSFPLNFSEKEKKTLQNFAVKKLKATFILRPELIKDIEFLRSVLNGRREEFRPVLDSVKKQIIYNSINDSLLKELQNKNESEITVLSSVLYTLLNEFDFSSSQIESFTDKNAPKKLRNLPWAKMGLVMSFLALYPITFTDPAVFLITFWQKTGIDLFDYFSSVKGFSLFVATASAISLLPTIARYYNCVGAQLDVPGLRFFSTETMEKNTTEIAKYYAEQFNAINKIHLHGLTDKIALTDQPGNLIYLANIKLAIEKAKKILNSTPKEILLHVFNPDQLDENKKLLEEAQHKIEILRSKFLVEFDLNHFFSLEEAKKINWINAMVLTGNELGLDDLAEQLILRSGLSLHRSTWMKALKTKSFKKRLKLLKNRIETCNDSLT